MKALKNKGFAGGGGGGEGNLKVNSQPCQYLQPQDLAQNSLLKTPMKTPGLRPQSKRDPVLGNDEDLVLILRT